MFYENNGQSLPNYSVSLNKNWDNIIAFIKGFPVGFIVLYLFYSILYLSIIGGIMAGFVNIFILKKESIKKRKKKLREQFYDLLEVISVSLMAGNTMIMAVNNAKKNLSEIYASNSDILIEIDGMIKRFDKFESWSSIFTDFANRSQIEDIANFARVYSAIDGRANPIHEIIYDNQQAILDNNKIELEIETAILSQKKQAKIMLSMPLLTLLVLNYIGRGFLDSIYTTLQGRIIATIGLSLLIVCFFMIKKFTDRDL
jgi:tight adherence protein B